VIRPSTVLWTVAVVATGWAMFQVKYEVMQLEDQLTHLNRQIATDREQIHVLKAEWSFLTQPSRLDALAERFLKLTPITSAQIGRIDTLPERPADAVAGAPGSPPSPHATRAAPASRSLGTRVATLKIGAAP
jgi:cell division protein FtsL